MGIRGLLESHALNHLKSGALTFENASQSSKPKAGFPYPSDYSSKIIKHPFGYVHTHVGLYLHLLVSTNDDILDCLVTELQILFNRNVVLDLQEDNGCGDDQGSGKNTPGGAKHGVVRGVDSVETPEDGSTSGLETLVETYPDFVSKGIDQSVQ